MVVLVKQVCCDCTYRVFQSVEERPTMCKNNLWQDQSINLTFPSREWGERCPMYNKIKELEDA